MPRTIGAMSARTIGGHEKPQSTRYELEITKPRNSLLLVIARKNR
jgi:hypothetical protein